MESPATGCGLCPDLSGAKPRGVAHGVGARRSELGNTILKRRQLGALGWRLVAVPFFEWEEFNDFSSAHEAANRDAYLKAKLADARSAAPAGGAAVTF